MSYKRWILITVTIFTISIIVGLVTPVSSTSVFSEDITAIEELGGILASLPSILIVVLIFTKNVSVLLLSFAFSPVFCLVPTMALIVNGWVLAIVSTIAVEEESLGFVLAALLPHGIIEIPALMLGEAAALSFGAMITMSLFNREKRKLVMPNLKHNLKYLSLAISLLLPAAIIETYVTPLFLR
jgi:stage II sporulation protein M